MGFLLDVLGQTVRDTEKAVVRNKHRMGIFDRSHARVPPCRRTTAVKPKCQTFVFFQHDLATDYALGEMHVILCRNVLIYFGVEMRERVLTMFSQSLARNGILCLGSSEALPFSCRATFADYIASERIYRLRATPVNAADLR